MVMLQPQQKKDRAPLQSTVTQGGRTEGDVTATAEERQSAPPNNNNTDGDVAANTEEEPELPSNQQ